MKLLDRITKWFFNTTKIEVNTDWRNCNNYYLLVHHFVVDCK